MTTQRTTSTRGFASSDGPREATRSLVRAAVASLTRSAAFRKITSSRLKLAGKAATCRPGDAPLGSGEILKGTRLSRVLHAKRTGFTTDGVLGLGSPAQRVVLVAALQIDD
jgi:hypothetical protein